MSDQTIRKGDLVRLIATDGYMPRIGSIGEVKSDMDEMEDYEVLFPAYPCPVPPGITWFAHRSWLLKINPPALETETERETEAI